MSASSSISDPSDPFLVPLLSRDDYWHERVRIYQAEIEAAVALLPPLQRSMSSSTPTQPPSTPVQMPPASPHVEQALYGLNPDTATLIERYDMYPSATPRKFLDSELGVSIRWAVDGYDTHATIPGSRQTYQVDRYSNNNTLHCINGRNSNSTESTDSTVVMAPVRSPARRNNRSKSAPRTGMVSSEVPVTPFRANYGIKDGEAAQSNPHCRRAMMPPTPPSPIRTRAANVRKTSEPSLASQYSFYPKADALPSRRVMTPTERHALPAPVSSFEDWDDGESRKILGVPILRSRGSSVNLSRGPSPRRRSGGRTLHKLTCGLLGKNCAITEKATFT
ncbi:MAG: hypothetical protein M1825_003758 [Sarcosagium campestre]|nr:MAG: hypothetical protein M1825_003758 [Sarcosagium campestre]